MELLLKLSLLATVVCCSLAAPSLRVMENEKVLDKFNNIILRWTILNSTKEIEIELQANCTGWIGIAFSEGTFGKPGAYGDIILGGYDDQLNLGYIQDKWVDLSVTKPVDGGEFDVHSDVKLILAEYRKPWTIFRVLRKLDTEDKQDVAIRPGPMIVTWTYINTDNTSVPHETGIHGFTSVTFIPRLQIICKVV